jgi:hypothetical protein
MACGIEHRPAPGKAGLVADRDPRQIGAVRGLRRQQLQQGLGAMEEPRRGGRADGGPVGRDLQAIALVGNGCKLKKSWISSGLFAEICSAAWA